MTEPVDARTGASALHIAVLGGGEIGLCITAVLVDAGATVDLVEPDAMRRAGAIERIRAQAPEMEVASLKSSRHEDSTQRVTTHATLGETQASPALVIEAGPEQLDSKRKIFRTVLDWTGGGIPIATTSSALTISEIVEDPADRRWCLCAHCLNPPTLLRLIECAPAPETDPDVFTQALSILQQTGFVPVPLAKEIPGFVINRLQSAVLREAYRLVDAGVIDVAGLDLVVTDGLGPRWALSGPFETAELNTPGGIRAHAARMGPAYKAIGESIGEHNVDWSGELVSEVERQRRAILPAEQLPQRVDWRRHALAQLLAARRVIIDDDSTSGDS